VTTDVSRAEESVNILKNIHVLAGVEQ